MSEYYGRAWSLTEPQNWPHFYRLAGREKCHARISFPSNLEVTRFTVVKRKGIPPKWPKPSG